MHIQIVTLRSTHENPLFDTPIPTHPLPSDVHHHLILHCAAGGVELGRPWPPRTYAANARGAAGTHRLPVLHLKHLQRLLLRCARPRQVGLTRIRPQGEVPVRHLKHRPLHVLRCCPQGGVPSRCLAYRAHASSLASDNMAHAPYSMRLCSPRMQRVRIEFPCPSRGSTHSWLSRTSRPNSRNAAL